MLFIGYYTRGTPYEGEYRVLSESLDALKIPGEFTAVDKFATWQQATQFKSTFIQRSLETHSCDLCYIDVDSIVISEPSEIFAAVECDIAASVFNRDELLSGVVRFNHTEKTRETVNRWCELNRQYPIRLPDGQEAWDQRTLRMAIKDTGAKFTELSPACNYIVGLSQKRYPGVTPCIIATRGALRFRSAIDS